MAPAARKANDGSKERCTGRSRNPKTRAGSLRLDSRSESANSNPAEKRANRRRGDRGFGARVDPLGDEA
jgi:hypothetical protein